MRVAVALSTVLAVLLVAHYLDSSLQVINFLKEFQKTSDCGEDLVAITVWHIMMGSVEWTRKADFLDKEALRHIKQNCKLLASFSKQAKTQLALLVTIQSYCYENMDFMKVRTLVALCMASRLYRLQRCEFMLTSGEDV